MAADRQDDVAARAAQLSRDLLAARPRADDEGPATSKLARIPVLAGVELLQPARSRPRRRRGHERLGGVAGRDDDVAREPLAVVGRDAKAAAGTRLDGTNLDMLADRCPARVLAEVAGELEAAEERLGVGVFRSAVEPVQPVRCQEGQRVPAFGEPALAHPAALEHDVRLPQAREVVGEREPRLSAADDHGVGRVRHGQWTVGVPPSATSAR